MPMEPPPSRYRVIERGGRLEVIDSVAGGPPPTARELLGGKGMPPPALVREKASATAPPGAAQNVAETITGNTRDDRGRLLLTTARWYDAKGPRTLALDEAGEGQLGGVVIAAAVAAVVALVLAVIGETVGWMIVFVAAILLSRARPIATAWLDRLDDA